MKYVKSTSASHLGTHAHKHTHRTPMHSVCTTSTVCGTNKAWPHLGSGDEVHGTPNVGCTQARCNSMRRLEHQRRYQGANKHADCANQERRQQPPPIRPQPGIAAAGDGAEQGCHQQHDTLLCPAHQSCWLFTGLVSHIIAHTAQVLRLCLSSHPPKPAACPAPPLQIHASTYTLL